MSYEPDEFDQLIGEAHASAVHLEMRDQYAVASEDEAMARWLSGDVTPRIGSWERSKRKPWLDLVRDTVGRGVAMRRARVVSMPASDYIKFEHSGTPLNIEAGEQVRWLDRADASDLLLPGNDLWLFDESVVRFGLFAGDGSLIGHKTVRDSAVALQVTEAFESVWNRAIPHGEFQI